MTLPTSPANIDHILGHNSRILGHNLRCNDEEDGDVKNGDIDCPEERWGGLVMGTDIVVTMQAGRGVQVCSGHPQPTAEKILKNSVQSA